MSIKERLNLKQEPVYLVDGTAYCYRAFYAFPDLKRADGFPTNALYIVLRLLLKLVREENPKYLGFFLDGKGPTFRHELYEPYKAQRTATPEPLLQQLDPIKDAVRTLGYTVEVSENCEADDIIASMAAKLKDERPVIIIGSDKDLKQCLDRNVYMWDPMAKQEKITSLQDFTDETGLAPEQWPDFQALIGDSSDNIPGVPGVGPKTAQKIFARLPSLEAIRDGLDDLTPAERKKIEPHVDDLFTFRTLTTLRTTDCADMDLKSLQRNSVNPEKVAAFVREYEFRSLLKELPDLFPKAESGQLSLLAPGTESRKMDIRRAEGPDQLPEVENKQCALVQTDKGLFLALDESEYRYTGAAEDLARTLRAAKTVYTPDVKELLARGETWQGLDLQVWFDLGLAAYLLNPEERDYSWKGLSRRLGPEVEPPPDNPARQALEVGALLQKRLQDAELEGLMRTLEMPLAPVLAAMERRGIAIDKEAFAAFRDEVNEHLKALTEKVYAVAGGPFNLRSSQQLGQLLFETLGLKPAGKTPGGAASTSQAVLEKLQGEHDVIDLILEYRKLEKLRSTYLEPLPKMAGEDGRLHTTFNQLATATGRLSSSHPNLQNIPIRGPQGERMRSCFVSEEGNKLVAADYSQIELRVLAHMSGDPTLVDAFQNNEDIHSRTAGVVFDVDPAAVTPDQRRNAKTINFGLIYGMGPQKLAQELHITLKEAKEFIARYFSKLSRLREFYEEVEEWAKEHGFVTTLAGRRRLLPDMHSRNSQLQSQARRQAINTVIQGSAADIIKKAMILVEADEDLRAMGGRCILQVHDELLLETPADVAVKAGERLQAIMESVEQLKAPLKVDVGAGDNWAQAH